MPPMGRSGRRAAGKQAYSMSAVDEYGKVIDDIYDFAEAQGLEIDGILQEGGAGSDRAEPRPRRPGPAGR
jgi:glutamine synthetase